MLTLIKNGLIVDGKGNDAFIGSIVVKEDKIIDVTSEMVDEASVDEVIDAEGNLVAPGFIDVHSHSDAYLIIEPNAPSKISQGITTEINGQCGGSIAPRFGEARLSSDWAKLLGDKLTWNSLRQYREVFDSVKPAINSIQFVGHNTLRASTMGYAGKAASQDDLQKMKYLLDKTLDEGAWGLTTGLIYQPGKYSNQEEVFSLASCVAEKGGFYATHMRSEGDRLLESIDEVIELARKTKIKAEISHLKTSGKSNWGKVDAAIEKIQGAIAEGLLLGADRYPYCAAGTDLDVVFPDWAGEGAAPAELKRLKDSNIRKRIVKELNEANRDWHSVMVGGTWCDETKKYSGKNIAEICLLENKTPGEVVCEILEKDECLTGAFFHGMSEDNLTKILSCDWVLAGSDASLRAPWGPLGKDHPHPRAYGTMIEFFRKVKAVSSRENAIKRMTHDAARRFEIPKRGVLEKGCYADIVIFDESNFSSLSTYSQPHMFATGVKYVFVNGVLSYKEGDFNKAKVLAKRAGRFLERS